jgi:hypothetical protein
VNDILKFKKAHLHPPASVGGLSISGSIILVLIQPWEHGIAQTSDDPRSSCDGTHRAIDGMAGASRNKDARYHQQ